MITENIKSLNESIKSKMIALGRFDKITLVVVTKNRNLAEIQEVLNNGFRFLGENRVQEALEKIEKIKDEVAWHMIGHLQLNKVNLVVNNFSLIHSVDSEKLLLKINNAASKQNKIQEILIQINIAEEKNKYGVWLEDYQKLVVLVKDLKNVKLKGLMCIAPFYDNVEDVRPIFRIMYALYQDLKSKFPEGQIEHLSMGMSNDYEIALEEGSNMLRIGTTVFTKK